MGTGAEVPRHFDQAIGVRTVLGTHDQQQVGVFRYVLDRDLAILGGIADILRVRAFDVGKLAAQGFDDVFGFVQAERGLGQVSHAVGIGHAQRFNLRRRSYDLGDTWSLAQRADDFIVIAVADEDQRIAFLGELYGFHVYLGDQWAGGVNHAQAAIFTGLADFRRDAMGAVDDALANGNLVHGIDKDGTFPLQFFDHKAVVDDLLTDVDGRAKGLKRDADDINRP